MMHKIQSDQTISRNRIPSARQNNNNKNDNDSTLSRYITSSMGGDFIHQEAVHLTRSSDAVSCWGDVPKRPTRLIDLITDIDHQDTVCPSTDTARLTTQSLRMPKRTNTNEPIANNSTLSTDHKLTHNVLNPAGDIQENSETVRPAIGTAGRERLLEWLRTSQAKRDENNRLVFTRWIDRIDSTQTQETVGANFTTTLSEIKTGTSCDLQSPQHVTIFPTPTPFGNLVAAPAYMLSSPMAPGVPSAAVSIASHKLNAGLLSSPYLPTIYPAKHATCPLQVVPINSAMSFADNNGIHLSTQTDRTDSVRLNTETFKADVCSLSAPSINHSSNNRMEVSQSFNINGDACLSEIRATSPDFSTIVEEVSAADQSNSLLYNNGNSYKDNSEQNTCNALPTVAMAPGQYIPLPLVNDPNYSQMSYYYTYPGQIAQSTCVPVQATTEFPNINQSMLYLIPYSNGGPSAVSGLVQTIYLPESCVCLPSMPQVTYGEINSSIDSFNRQSEDPNKSIPCITSELPRLPTIFPSNYSSYAPISETTFSDTCTSEGLDKNRPSERNSMENSMMNGSLQSPLENMDLPRWYSALPDIESMSSSVNLMEQYTNGSSSETTLQPSYDQ